MGGAKLKVARRGNSPVNFWFKKKKWETAVGRDCVVRRKLCFSFYFLKFGCIAVSLNIYGKQNNGPSKMFVS